MEMEILKQLVQEFDLENAFENIDVESQCAACCTVGDGGNSSC